MKTPLFTPKNLSKKDEKCLDYIKNQKIIINKAIEKNLNQVFFSKFKHHKAAIYILYPEGHRYRSIIGLEIYKMLGGNKLDFLKCAVGIECIHHASLVFDDLPCMDDSNTRKGKTTAHIKFGEGIAILGGLYLWNIGRRLVYNNAREHLKDINEIDQVTKLVCNSINGMLTGQEMDLKKKKTDKELKESIFQKNRLFHLACVLPPYFLKKKQHLNPLSEVGRTLDEVGVNLSVGYQLFDDLRDIEGNPKIIGKAIDSDVDSSARRFGVSKVRKELDERKRKIIDNLDKIQPNSRLRSIIEYILNDAFFD